ncbi:MAG: RNA 2'-phosphotransferase [Candidatus Thermoplasmatota archaeon]|nr:RNA 2'-phosphotransferase [Candidatus Thermoplasmatota archaeon]
MHTEEVRNCQKDGPFRGEECPKCCSRGRLLMKGGEIESAGRILAGMLRHFPENYGVHLNDHGWLKIYTIVPVIRAQKKSMWWLTPFHIEALVLTDPKGRYQINDHGEIRATYGHTIPVLMDDLPHDNIPELLYYQTTDEELEFIRETGISPSDKSWVHLSLTPRQAYISGLFHIDSPAVVPIDTVKLIESGTMVYRSNADVFLVEFIPPEFVLDKIEDTFEPDEDEKTEILGVRQRQERRKSEREQQ